MKILYKRLSIIFVMAFAIMLGCFSNVFAADNGIVGIANLNGTTENSAKVGDQLLHPEKGWKRYDDSAANIYYGGKGWNVDINSNRYNSSAHYGNSEDSFIRFNFTGTKLRLISTIAHTHASKIKLLIDGINYDISQFNSGEKSQSVIFTNNSFSNSEHSVVISKAVTPYLGLDAIDIDINGELKSYNANLITVVSNLDLNKSTDSLQAGQTDTLTATITPDNATNKNVTWKSSDESIATVDSTGKVTAIKEGTATITATTTDGSNLSASCVVTVIPRGTTPTDPTDNIGNAMLTITMTNGMEKEYDLSMTEVNAFVNWYNGRAAGTGNVYYTFNKNASLAAFTKRTEYILYDKILEFNVDQYTK